jgi:hypothetical protein
MLYTWAISGVQIKILLSFSTLFIIFLFSSFRMVAMTTPYNILFRRSAAAYVYMADFNIRFYIKGSAHEVILTLGFLHESVPSQSHIFTLNQIF